MKNEIKTMVNGKKMIINGVEIEEKYWKNQKIVTTWDIGKIHKREPKEINRLFRSNKDKFIENTDYFTIDRNTFSECNFNTQDFIPNNTKEIYLFTQIGYLALNKLLKDEYSWNIQREMILIYFAIKTGKATLQPKQLTKIEVLKMALETELENERLRNENKAQCEIIKGLNGELEPYQLEDIINRIIRANGGNYGAKYNEVYRVFKERYHIDLKTRMTNYNKTVRAKDRFKSVLKYALANNYGKDLLNVVTTLFPESVKIVRDGINQNTGLGKDEPVLLDWSESGKFRSRNDTGNEAIFGLSGPAINR